MQATGKSAAIFRILDHIRVASDIRLQLNNKEMQAWTQSVAGLRAIDVVNFRFRFFLYIRQYYRFLSCCRWGPDCVRGEGLRLSVCWQSSSRVHSAHYQERARVFLPLVTPGHVCRRCNLHNKIISVLHRRDRFISNEYVYMEVEWKYERVLLNVFTIAQNVFNRKKKINSLILIKNIKKNQPIWI